MKTKIMIKNLGLGLVTIFLMMLSVTGYSQACTGNMVTVSLQNFSQTANTVEYDVYFKNTGTTSIKLNTASITTVHSAGMLPSGATGTVSVVTPPANADFPGYSNTNSSYVTVASTANGIRSTGTTRALDANSIVLDGTSSKKWIRMRLTSSLPWAANTNATFTIQAANLGALQASLVQVYCSTNTSSTTLQSPGTLTLGAPVSYTLGQTCATQATVNVTNPSCFGGTGSAVVTLSSPSPSVSSVSYTVDSGSSTSATLSLDGSFTVSGLSAGTHSIAVTNTGCTQLTTGNFTVTAPSQLVASSSAGTIACNGGTTTVTVSGSGGTAPYTGTGSFTVSAGPYSYTVTDAHGCTSTTSGTVSQPAQLTNSTTATACDSYVWSVNGTTYTSSGTYTGTTTNGSGCTVNETLNLTINHSSTTSETQVACDVYRWHGTAYSASGTYTFTSTNASGCTNVATLHLTINHSSTTIETQTACDSYTWNGTTYTTSGTYTFTSPNASGCDNIATLHLTINNSSTTSETQTACNNYTWHGTTYTASGDYTFSSTNASGCTNVATLHLTINNSSTTEETQTACESYTWNGTTYTASGDYTYSSTNGSGCTNVATLHLTINSNAITYQSSDPVICKLANATATASVTALGSTYQWYSQGATVNSGWTPLANNVNYSGVTSNTLTIKRTTLTLPVTGTKYQVVVSGSGGCAQATSTPFTLKESLASKGAAITAKSAANTALLPTNTTCVGSTLSLTLAAGSVGNIQWMYSSNGSPWTQFATSAANVTNAATQVNSAFTITTPALAAGSTSFKVIATNGGCSSLDDTAHILNITVSAQPVAGTISGGDVTVCTPLATGIDATGTALTSSTPITNSTVLTLGGSLNVGTIVWQKSINYVNTTSITPTWTAVANLTATTAIGASYSGAGTSALTVGNLAVTTWYRAIVTNGACTDISTPVKITVTPPAKAGVLTSTVLNSSSNPVVSATVCYGGDITFTSATYTGSAIQWQVSTTSSTAGFSNIGGATASTYTMTGVTYAPLSKFYVRSMITSGSCTAAYSAVNTITVNPTSVGGIVTGGGVVCNTGIAGTLKVTGYTGTIQWQYSTDNSTWSNAPFNSATSGYQNPTGATTFATTSATATAAAGYIVTNVTANTYFRALVTSGVCYSATSTVAEYVVGNAIATSISADNTIVCPSTGTTLHLASGSVGTITWQKSVAPFATWTNVTTSISSDLFTGNLTATTEFRAVLTTGSCTDTTAPITITVNSVKATSKGITASLSSPAGAATTQICNTSTIVKTLSVTPGYIGTIQWQSATTNTPSSFTDITGATSETYTIDNTAANIGANYYRVVFTYSCGAPVISSTLTVYYKSCSLKAPEKEVVADFGVIASPSPFTENFNLNLTTSSEDKVQVMVYDMIGKLIDQKEVSPSEATTLQVGDRYPSGVYNVIVTQGENTKTLRVIKR